MSGTYTYFYTHTKSTSHNTSASRILDTRTIDHMVCNPSLFTQIKSAISFSIKLPNGSFAFVTHIKNIQLTKALLLRDFFCVPSFSFNLISATKLTHSLTCCILFFSHYCFIQDLLSWKTFGKGELKHGLHHLVCSETSPSALAQSLSDYTAITHNFSTHSLIVFK